MRYTAGLSLALLVSAASAAEPTVSPPAIDPPAATAPVNPPAPSTTPAASPATASVPAKPLDLRIGKISSYMPPKQVEAMVSAPDLEKDAIVVEANRELLPMKFEQPVPEGFPPLTLWWALMNPANSWRILVPDVNRRDPGPLTMEEKVPAREFRWGP